MTIAMNAMGTTKKAEAIKAIVTSEILLHTL
jgi:hypothetical protein